jgi:uncharacterized protein (TIGR03790 family)
MRTLFATILLLAAAGLIHADTGDDVIVVYNRRLPASKDVAEHYADRRHVPAEQIVGFDLSTNDIITRAEFRDSLQKPLADALEEKKLWHIGSDVVPETNGHPKQIIWKVQRSKIRYAVLCYGVPLRIDNDLNLHEKNESRIKPELRRNGAAVDSELALLPEIQQNLPLAGPLNNSFYTVTNSDWMHPTNGMLMVARLDGPTAAVARSLVDKAMEAESNGLCGRGYFDVRSLSTNSPYAEGDQWIFAAGQICHFFAGYDGVIDTNSGTFAADFPMSQIGIYCGWYDDNVSGPLAQPTVEFMPGAFAYHLHSFSAATLRSTNQFWTGPLLARGATVTMGCVDEPYLSGTPDLSVFFARWVAQGFTFGQAAYACQRVLSWQTTVVGDPLYRPFGTPLQQLLDEQKRTHNKALEWTYDRALNLDLMRGEPPVQVSTFLQTLPLTKESAVLSEKLGEIYDFEGKPLSAIESFENALQLGPSPLQRVRLRLELADKFNSLNQTNQARANLKALLTEVPDYPGKSKVMQKLQDLEDAPVSTNKNP